MHSKLLVGLSLVTGLMSATAFAEPAIQPGDSLESLSKVKVTTTVNGQAGSIQDLVASGQIRIIDSNQIAADPAQAGSETEQVQSNSATIANVPQAADINNTTAQTTEVLPEQVNSPVLEQTAQAAPESADPMQPNTELAAQHTEQVMEQEAAVVQAPVNENIAAAAMISSSAAAPVNTAETNEAFAATPEAMQPNNAAQAAPEADLTDAPLNASPEAPAVEQTEN
ncbi:hypothetical protein [Acinetobacter sp.]|uniref:hypothetical protein n=1 Tax=Acinetobacter sp. TaxID=472 RepID=UPI0038911429